MAVSVCIPTFRRADLLHKAIMSAFANDVRPLEIVVSDDDYHEDQAAAIMALPRPEGIAMRYVANRNAPGQSGNVNSAFSAASHERIVLMHDDDFFLEGGLDYLVEAWDSSPVCLDAVYGRQIVCDIDGRPQENLTQKRLQGFFKTDDYLGIIDETLWAALVLQFPCNGMMMRRDLALAVGYPSEKEVGRVHVDVIFGIKYAMKSQCPFLALGDFISGKRETPGSVLDRRFDYPIDCHLAYEALRDVKPNTELAREGLRLRRRRFAEMALWGYLHHDQPWKAAALCARHLRHLPGWRRRIRLSLYTAAACGGIRLAHERPSLV